MPGLGDRRDLFRDLALMLGAGLFLAVVGPFGSVTVTPWVRFVYWPFVLVGGGVIGIAVDEIIRPRLRHPWLRWLTTSVVMTPGVCVLVALASTVAFPPQGGPHLSGLAWQVFVISAAVMGVRQLAPRPSSVDAAQAATSANLATQPDAAFRKRLSAKRREARLIAVEAEDHYLRVHTDAGNELIAARFADALAELADVPGFQAHRSWWLAKDAIEDVAWTKGRGEARLVGGLTAPVSRTYAKALKAAGWF